MALDFLTNTPLLEYMGTTGMLVVLSTGMADESDIDAAIAAVRRGGKSDVLVLHCTSAYPTPVDQVNLKRMLAIQRRFDVSIGFSDHSEGPDAAVQAVTLGARMIEKHFTLDHDLPGPDHWFSSTPDEMSALVALGARSTEQRMGSGDLQPATIEVRTRGGRIA